MIEHNGACGKNSQTVPAPLSKNCSQESFSSLLLTQNSVSTGMAGQGVHGQRFHVISMSNGVVWPVSLLAIALGGVQIQLVPPSFPP